VAVLRLSHCAEEDIVSILSWSLKRFGTAAQRRYESLLTVALSALCADPERYGSNERPEFGAGVRTYHLRFSRDEAWVPEGTVHRPRHLIVYRITSRRELQVIRVLHDSMEVRRHLPPR
jgi:toxin ParE1/3/4